MNILCKSRVSEVSRWIKINSLDDFKIKSSDIEISFYKEIINLAIVKGIYQIDIDNKIWCDGFPVVVELKDGHWAGILFSNDDLLN
jgi:hypothetical protein